MTSIFFKQRSDLGSKLDMNNTLIEKKSEKSQDQLSTVAPYE